MGQVPIVRPVRRDLVRPASDLHYSPRRLPRNQHTFLLVGYSCHRSLREGR